MLKPDILSRYINFRRLGLSTFTATAGVQSWSGNQDAASCTAWPKKNGMKWRHRDKRKNTEVCKQVRNSNTQNGAFQNALI